LVSSNPAVTVVGLAIVVAGIGYYTYKYATKVDELKRETVVNHLQCQNPNIGLADFFEESLLKARTEQLANQETIQEEFLDKHYFKPLSSLKWVAHPDSAENNLHKLTYADENNILKSSDWVDFSEVTEEQLNALRDVINKALGKTSESKTSENIFIDNVANIGRDLNFIDLDQKKKI
jgi:hypothetical protein